MGRSERCAKTSDTTRCSHGCWKPTLTRTPAAPTISLPYEPCVRETLCGGELGPEIPRRYGGAKRAGAAAAAAAYGGYGGGAAPRQEEPDRVDYAAAFDIGGLEGVTVRTLRMAGSLEEPYGSLLALLSDCYEAGPEDAVLYRQQHKGATYRSLAAVAYWAGVRKA
jgi:hypothetical protein